MDASKVECSVQEVIADKTRKMHDSLDRAEELLQRAKRILDRIGNQAPPCEGICPMCGKVWDDG